MPVMNAGCVCAHSALFHELRINDGARPQESPDEIAALLKMRQFPEHLETRVNFLARQTLQPFRPKAFDGE